MIVGTLYFIAITAVLLLGVYVGPGILIIAFLADQMSMGILPHMLGSVAWNAATEFLFVAVPLYILLGELLMRSGVADRLYKSLAMWLGWLPGGLIHANIGACAFFAATSGSSVATAATIGTAAQPSLLRLGYDQKLVLGSIAGAGTLGILIPPSINLVVYGAMTGTSVGRLFAAALIPGFLLAATMSLVVIVLSLTSKTKAGAFQETYSVAERFRSIVDVFPVFLVFLTVIGSIYAGLATPTEAAAMGVVVAVLLAMWNKTLSIALLHAAFLSAIRTTAMMMLVVISAFGLNFVLSVSGVPQSIATWVADLGLGPYQTIWMLLIFYAILGCFIEALAMMVMTIGVVFPLVTHLGFDGVWFGVFLTVLMEMALITPPMGLNLFVVQNIRLKPGPIVDIYVGIIPFVIAMFIFLAVLIYLPNLALWLPSKLF